MAVTSIVTGGLLESPSKLLLYGLEPGAAAAAGSLVTLGLVLSPSRLLLHGMAPNAGGGSGVTITGVTVLGGTSVSVAWTGTADEYRIDGGTATALPDGTSPDTITGLTANTTYTIELRLDPGTWSASETFTTDNVGGGGGAPATFSAAVVRSTTAIIGGGLR